MFVDEARILVVSGRGGNGAATFRREKYRPKGGPDGGNGGTGGSVVLVAGPSVDSLSHLRDHPHQRAKTGEPGRSGNRTGAVAPDLEVAVPLGTVVKDANGVVLADLARHGQRFVAAKGGRGGRGNASFLSDRRRVPGFAELGEPGEEWWLRLELRLIADVAVIGYPNAGKSTLVASLSAARPKIADYPFTTVEPSLGVVESEAGRFTICDVPGLIEGAHEGKGLGLKFLKHAERALVFLHLVDLASGRDSLDDYKTVRNELGRFREELLERTEIVVLNKIDLVRKGDLEAATQTFAEEGIATTAISAREKNNLEELIALLSSAVEAARSQQEAAKGFELYRTVPDDRLAVTREGQAWVVRGKKVERWVSMTDMGNAEAVSYLQSRLERAGVERALEQAGANHGDDVKIGDVTFEWWPAGASPDDYLVEDR